MKSGLFEGKVDHIWFFKVKKTAGDGGDAGCSTASSKLVALFWESFFFDITTHKIVYVLLAVKYPRIIFTYYIILKEHFSFIGTEGANKCP